jgi:glutaredoxin 3
MPTNLNNKTAVVWSQANCPACNQAKALLNNANIPTTVKMLNVDITKDEFFSRLPNARSVPQVFIDDEHIGGLHELEVYLG